MESNEHRASDITDDEVMDFLKDVSVSGFDEMTTEIKRSCENLDFDCSPESMWGTIKWMMANRIGEYKFSDAAKIHQYLMPSRAQ